MASVTLGSKGLVNADLVLVRGASFACTFTHVDAAGDPIPHDGWSAKCRAHKYACERSHDVDLQGCVSFGDGGDIYLAIPTETTEAMLGEYEWDLMVTDDKGFVTRLAYGKANVYDSLAMD